MKATCLSLAIAALFVPALMGPPAAAAPAVTAEVTDGTLRVSGSPSADIIALRLDSVDPNQLQIDVGDDGSAEFTLDRSTFDAINVDAGNGNDAIRIDEVHGIFTTIESTQIDGENGKDALFGGSGAERFIGGNGDDLADGNGGADTAFLGRGDDVFVWDPGDGSDVVEGGAGSDTMVFNGSGGNEVMAATAVGERVSFTRDLGGIVMDLTDVEAIDVRTLAGTDTVTVNDVRGTDLDRVHVDLARDLGGSNGDAQADAVTVVGTDGDDSIAADANGAAVEVSGLAAFVRITHADPATDTLILDTGAGVDNVALDQALAALILVTVL
jgi:RTX calcium-binding nonapeptide repeat (4 copies)